MLELKEHKVQQERLELQEHKELRVQELRERQELRDLLDQREHKDLVVQQELREQLGQEHRG
jgi:hypothetical protein